MDPPECGYFVAVIRAHRGTRKTILSTRPRSRKTILSAPGTWKTTLSGLGIRLPKLNAEGSSPFARSICRAREAITRDPGVTAAGRLQQPIFRRLVP